MSLKSILKKKKFLKSIEIIPSRYKIDKKLVVDIKRSQQHFDYLDIACCPMANLRISPISFAHHLIIKGVPGKKLILNFSTRDRNSLALQSEILGTYSMGIDKILLVRGDSLTIGNSKKSNEVFELSTNDLIRIVRNLNKGFDYCNNKLKFDAGFNIGSTINIDKKYNSIRSTIKKRSDMGSIFFITQPLFAKNDFELLVKLSKNNKYKILAGILPIKNKQILDNLKNKINGISIDYFADMLSCYKKHLDGVHIMTSGDIKMAAKIAKTI